MIDGLILGLIEVVEVINFRIEVRGISLSTVSDGIDITYTQFYGGEGSALTTMLMFPLMLCCLLRIFFSTSRGG